VKVARRVRRAAQGNGPRAIPAPRPGPTQPSRAVVFSFHEKTQCQALDRTQPSLPIKRGRAGTMTHDYKRNGTIDLFAAMNMATGEVLTDLRKGHAGADVLRFFKQIDASVPRGLSVHVVLDNLSAHSTPQLTKWLAHRNGRRWHLHYTPTSSSWLNLIERWFKELTDRRLRRGVFTSVPDLIQAITTWAEHWNTDPTPFIWKATAEDIIAKVRRGRTTCTRSKRRRTTSCSLPEVVGNRRESRSDAATSLAMR
jgi:transposase